MSNSGLTPVALVGEGNPLQITLLYYVSYYMSCVAHAQPSRDILGLWQYAATIHCAGRRKDFCVIGFLSVRPSYWAGDCAPPSHTKLLLCHWIS